MTDIAELALKIDSSQARTATKDLDKFGKEGRSAEGAATSLGKSSTAAFGAMAAAATVALGAVVALAASSVSLRKFVDATVTADKAQAQLGAALLSTGGAAQKTIDDLNKNAAALQKVTAFGDETINAMQGVLLTFTQIKGDEFDSATDAVIDLATAMGTDLNAAALQVGKALNDPILGMTALSRSGIQFTEAQKEVVKGMVDVNNVAGAQSVILKELETQFGGSAEAARGTLGGALASLGNAWGDVFELGTEASAGLSAAVESLIGTISDPKFVASIQSIGASMFAMAEVGLKALQGIAGAFQFAADNVDVLVISVGILAVRSIPAAIGGLTTLVASLFGGATAAGAMAFAMNAIPLVALATGLTLLYRKYQDIGDTTGVTAAVTDVLKGSVDNLNAALDTYANDKSEPARLAALGQAEAMAAVAESTLAAVETNLAYLKSLDNPLFQETANQPGGLLFDVGAQVDAARASLEMARETIQNLTDDADGMGGSLDDAEDSAGGVARASGLINFDGAASSAADLAKWLGISLSRALALSATTPAMADEDLAMSQPVILTSEGRAAQREAVKNFKALQSALDDAGSSGSSAGGAIAKGMKEAEREAEQLADEIERLEFDADPIKRYNAELSNLNDLLGMEDGLSQGAYDVALQKLNDGLADQIPMVNDVASAWGDFIAGGLRDFKGFARSILDSFTSLLSQMIATAARNKILIGLGTSGSVAGGAASAATGGGGGALGQVGSLLGGGSGGLLGGIASGASGIFGTGGLFGTVGANIAGTVGNLIAGPGSALAASFAGIGAALGAAVPIIGAVVAAISFFKTKTTLLDSGLKITADNVDTLVQSFDTVNKKKFWGLSSKTSTNLKPLEVEGGPITDAVSEIISQTRALGEVLGLGSDNFASFAASVQVSLKGLSETEAQAEVQRALGQVADQFSYAALGWFQENIGDVIREGETAGQAMVALAGSLQTVNATFDALGFSILETSIQGGIMAREFADLFGGLDAMAQATGGYYARFYTQAEQVGQATKTMTAALADLGVIMPSTIEGFRALVTQAESMGDMQQVADLIKIAPAFAAIFDGQKALDDAAAATAATAAATAATAAAANAKAAAATAAGNAADAAAIVEATLKDLADGVVSSGRALDAAADDLRNALSREIEALKSALSDATSDLNDAFRLAKDAAMGTTTQDAERANGALSIAADNLRASFEKLQETTLTTAQDRQSAAAEGLSNATDSLRASFEKLQETTLTIAQDRQNVATDALSTATENLRASFVKLQETTLTTAQDRQSAASVAFDSATSSLNSAFATEQEKTRAAFQLSIDGLSDNLTGARERLNASQAIADALSSALNDRLFPSIEAQRQSQDAAAGYLQSLVGMGRITDSDKLQSALGAVANLSADTYATLEEYRAAFDRTSGAIAALDKTAGVTLSADERAVSLLERQIDNMQAQSDRAVAILEQQLKGLLGIDEGVLSVKDAIAEFTAAQSELAGADAALELAKAQEEVLAQQLNTLLGIDEGVLSLSDAITAFTAAQSELTNADAALDLAKEQVKIIGDSLNTLLRIDTSTLELVASINAFTSATATAEDAQNSLNAANAQVELLDEQQKSLLGIDAGVPLLGLAITAFKEASALASEVEILLLQQQVDGIIGVQDSVRSLADAMRAVAAAQAAAAAAAKAQASAVSAAANSSAAPSNLPSFDGGGFTGTGSRSGGLDGKGGFAAMLHPNETVFDHSRARSGNNNEMVEELRKLRAEVGRLTAYNRQTTINTGDTAFNLKDINRNGVQVEPVSGAIFKTDEVA